VGLYPLKELMAMSRPVPEKELMARNGPACVEEVDGEEWVCTC
jgi:hypothetical protein